MWKISGHWRGLEHPVRALGLFRRAKVASVCQPGPAGCRSTVWGIIDWRSQWSVPSAAQRPGPDGAFSPGPGVINVPSRWETMPQPRSSRRPPPGDTCRHCTIHRLCSHQKRMIIERRNSQRIASALIEQIKTTSSEVVWFGHTCRAWRKGTLLYLWPNLQKRAVSLMWCINGH